MLVALAIGGFYLAPAVQTAGAVDVVATRFTQNPLITVRSSASLGDDIDGPTVIRVPAFVQRPLGRYYMYFAHHMGQFIRLAYADTLTGPWRIYEPGVLQVRDTAFYRPQPDPIENLENFYTHVASPEILVDAPRQRLVMWFHGWYTEGRQWPVGEPAAREWARQNGYGQFTQAAESSDGIHFELRPAITRSSYLRVFEHEGWYYGMARLGLLLRSKDPFATFQNGPNPFEGGSYGNRIRHVALARRDGAIDVFFTGIGDAPERIMMSTMYLTGDWQSWRAQPAIEVLRPQTAYECATLPNVPSEAGDVKGPVRQLRDPDIFEEDGKRYLFYSICGEQGIAGADLNISATP